MSIYPILWLLTLLIERSGGAASIVSDRVGTLSAEAKAGMTLRGDAIATASTGAMGTAGIATVSTIVTSTAATESTLIAIAMFGTTCRTIPRQGAPVRRPCSEAPLARHSGGGKFRVQPTTDALRMSISVGARTRPRHLPLVAGRRAHTYLRTRAPNGTMARIALRSGLTYGAAMTRGDRHMMEDTTAASCITLPCDALRQDIVDTSHSGTRDPWFGWSAHEAGGPELAGQVVWFGVYDGHGGSAVAKLLENKLHLVFESAEPEMITDTVRYTRSLGGYFRRFTGGILEPWVRTDLLEAVPPPKRKTPEQKERTLSELARQDDRSPSRPLEHYSALATDAPGATHTALIERPAAMHGKHMTVAQRATLAYLMVRRARRTLTQIDREVQQNEAYDSAGSTATVLLLHSLDEPVSPWYSSEYVMLTTVHVGDSSFLLCSVADGLAVELTPLHHMDNPAEAERLSRLGAGVITDSFGESRYLGTLANTRAIGDANAKRYGVTAEPDVRSHVVRGADFAFAIGFTDGVSTVLTDQEIVDLCRTAPRPDVAAQRIKDYAMDLGSEDNISVVVVPLRGWGKTGGDDKTKEQLEQRLSDAAMYRRRRT